MSDAKLSVIRDICLAHELAVLGFQTEVVANDLRSLTQMNEALKIDLDKVSSHNKEKN